jgi:glyoxylase-like metal-dependent hydrolase (beta-lactamase superfamily II)
MEASAPSIICGLSTLSHGLSWIDLLFQGRSRAIATAVIHGTSGVVLVDPGPTSCSATLDLGLQRLGLRLSDVRAVMLTHIHLDHAGATGTLVRAHPDVRVFVHERGARHMADPSKLLDSATRLYGDQMDRLWGACEPVPAANMVVVTGGERIDACGRILDVAYTPGHASHHVSFYDRSSGVAFVGDVAGVTIDGGYVLPPTPPPDVDLEAWRVSVERIEAWSPETLFLTHFGPAPSVRPHLQALLENLDLVSGWVRQTLAEPGTDEERSARFADRLRHQMRTVMSEAQMASYPIAAPFEQLWLGLARYWRKKG